MFSVCIIIHVHDVCYIICHQIFAIMLDSRCLCTCCMLGLLLSSCSQQRSMTCWLHSKHNVLQHLKVVYGIVIRIEQLTWSESRCVECWGSRCSGRQP